MRIRPNGFIFILVSLILVLIVIFVFSAGRDAATAPAANTSASTAPTLSAVDVRRTRELQSLLRERFNNASIERVIVSERTVIIAAFMRDPVDNTQETAEDMLDASRGMLGGLNEMRVLLGDDTGIISQYDWVSSTGRWTVTDA